jgi:diguanylate cyclase (GGDEF)-like protein/PAS domain S-box-containing protein
MALDINCKEFKLVAEGIKSGLAVYEAYNEGEDFIFRYVNRSVVSIEKINKKDLIGNRVTKLFPGIKEFGLLDVFQTVYKTGKSLNFPIHMYHDNRIQGWRDNFVFKLDDTHIIVIYDDLTAEKKKEEELFYNQEKYKTFLENASSMVFVHSYSGKIIETNAVAAKRLGYSKKELIELSMFDIVPTYQTQSKVKKLEIGNKPVIFESKMIDKNGNLFPVETRVKKFTLEDNEYLFAIVSDLTEKKETERKLIESRKQFELAVKGSQDGIWDWNVETNELYLSKRWKEILGYKDIELENRFSTFVQLLHPDDKEHVLIEIDNYFSGRIKKWENEFRMRHKNGEYRWILAKGEAIRNKNGIAYRMAGSHSDITEKKLAINRIIESENQFREAFETSAIGMALVSLKGEWIRVNDAICEMLGYSRSELTSRTFQEITHPDDLSLDLKHINETIEGKIRSYKMEKRYQHKNGSYIWTLLNVSLVRDSEGNPIHFVLQIVDLSVQKEVQKKLELAVQTDSLTGVRNRHYLNQEIIRQVELCRRHKDNIAVAIIDIDYFKHINDTYGHLAGDFVLKKVAQSLQNKIRNIDTLCRYGGEEFVILLPRTSQADSCVVADRLRKAIYAADFIYEKIMIKLTVSIGITMLKEKDTVESLLERADMALYQAKHSGRNQVVCKE